MITVNVHTNASGLHNDVPLADISDIVKRDDSVLWIDVVNPSAEEIRLLGEEFHFHPLALEDAARQRQRPKLDRYDQFIFIAFYGVAVRAGRIETAEISLFAGRNYLVTVHDGSLPEIAETATRWCDTFAENSRRGVGLLVYTLLDALVDGYFPVVDALADQIDALEHRVFEQGDMAVQSEIFRLRRDLLDLRRLLGPEREVMNVLVRRDAPLFGEGEIIYFNDVYDHILRITDAIDTYRDELASALDALQSVAANRLNIVVRRLTSWSIILMSMTLIAGVYGMNFDNMPELHWVFGYLWALGLMGVVGGGLFGLFKRIDWL